MDQVQYIMHGITSGGECFDSWSGTLCVSTLADKLKEFREYGLTHGVEFVRVAVDLAFTPR